MKTSQALILALGILTQAQTAKAQLAGYEIPGVQEVQACVDRPDRSILGQFAVIKTCYGDRAANILDVFRHRQDYRSYRQEFFQDGVYEVMYLNPQYLGNGKDRCWMKIKNADGTYVRQPSFGCEFYTAANFAR